MFTCNRRANGQIVAEQDAFRLLFALFTQNYCLKCEKQEDHRVAQRQISGTTNQVVWTTSSHQRIRSTCSNNKFAPANQIDPFQQQVASANQDDPFGQQVCPNQSYRPDQQVCTSESDRPVQRTSRTSESDQPVRTTSSHQQIRSTRSDNKFAPANQIVRTVILRLHFSKFA